MNKASPMPIDAMNVALDFSAANIKMVKSSSTVRMASMNKPWAIEVPPLKVVSTSRGVENMQETRATATMSPSTWAGTSSKPRAQESVPLITIPNTTWIKISAFCQMSKPQPVCELYGRIEEAIEYAVEGPSCSGKGKSERQTDEKQLIQRGLDWRRKRVCNLSSPKCKEKKENCADELAWHSNQVSSRFRHRRLIRRILASLVLRVCMEAWQLASPISITRRASCARTMWATKWVLHCWCGGVWKSNGNSTNWRRWRAGRRGVMLWPEKRWQMVEKYLNGVSDWAQKNDSRIKPASH